MKDALTRAHTHGRVTQDLAGAPELVRRYEHGTPPVKALLQVAMDARRTHTAAVVAGGGVAARPQPQHTGSRQAIAVRGPADQRRGQLPGQRHGS
ncbi:hypothetical protein ACFVZC_32840 [Streptomyces marokkonensis]|uniref:Uncharacterized protein n=1 Tax=Streptomyces marokkonensis TaxID=324855 RepID=A0ABW6QHE9_9ACTN